jgi:transcriptional regulator GlxA family with amidase domain
MSGFSTQAIAPQYGFCRMIHGGELAHEGVARSLGFLSRFWHRPIQVIDLVRAAAMSRRGFLKAFTRQTGRSPGGELRRLRLEGAMKLLVESDQTAQAIARRCGFKKVNSFNIAFKRATGLAPVQYRKKFGRPPPRSGRQLKRAPRRRCFRVEGRNA